MASESVPYIDTKTPTTRWYVFNIIILIATFAMVALASLILEYDIARLQHPGVVFIDTPIRLDLIVTSIILLLGLANISVMIFVFLRHLWLRKWMIATTIIGWMLLAVLVLILQNRFIPVIIP